MKTPFINANIESISKMALCFLFAQLHNVYESVTILCRRGFPQQAYVLLRSLQEGYIRICYILHEEERDAVVVKVREYIEYESIERKKMLHSVEKDKELNSEVKEKWLKQKDALLRSCRKIKARGGLWPEKSIEWLCDKAKLQSEYILYRHFSSFGHLSPRTAFGRMVVNEGEVGLEFGHTKERTEIIPVLGLAHRYFLLILIKLSLYFRVEAKQELRWHISLRADLPDDIKKLFVQRKSR
ncbi:hypothetical protein KAV79_05160 [Candidatus Aerophobetes bacterium]|nr:hypothetical protein [Candidatus Aerophobetes bacterium]